MHMGRQCGTLGRLVSALMFSNKLRACVKSADTKFGNDHIFAVDITHPAWRVCVPKLFNRRAIRGACCGLARRAELLHGFPLHRSRSGKGRSALPPFRNSVRVTVFTFHKVDVVPAGERLERRIHGFDVEAAVGQTRVAQGAGGPGVLVVSRVAGQATQPFVHSHTGAIVA